MTEIQYIQPPPRCQLSPSPPPPIFSLTFPTISHIIKVINNKVLHLTVLTVVIMESTIFRVKGVACTGFFSLEVRGTTFP